MPHYNSLAYACEYQVHNHVMPHVIIGHITLTVVGQVVALLKL